ncbi:MAG: CBS domain-containing protein [Deltaproteobacteria bacterium]|nr:CBS domain-containing protein [Deltaproteobacteria bacterium]MBW2414735.1 CBS domain-containing protein [Deltaproteobacteria bacterium]
MGLTARDVMQGEVHVVDSKMKLSGLQDAFLEKGVSGFPVVDNGRLVGVVSRSDVVRGLAVERSRAGMVSDYYRSSDAVGAEADHASFDAVAAQTGVRVANMTVSDVMAPSPTTVPADQPLREVAQMLVDQHIHRVPVVEGERLVGILTSLDVVRLVADGGLADR